MENCIKTYKNGSTTIGGWYWFRTCRCCSKQYQVRTSHNRGRTCQECRPLVEKEYMRLQRIARKKAYFNVREIINERTTIGKI